jgi:hypothetical protein
VRVLLAFRDSMNVFHDLARSKKYFLAPLYIFAVLGTSRDYPQVHFATAGSILMRISTTKSV